MKEEEQAILTGAGRNNEIRELCERENHLKGFVEGAPLGSCEWMIAKARLRGIRDRLSRIRG